MGSDRRRTRARSSECRLPSGRNPQARLQAVIDDGQRSERSDIHGERQPLYSVKGKRDKGEGKGFSLLPCPLVMLQGGLCTSAACSPVFSPPSRSTHQ